MTNRLKYLDLILFFLITVACLTVLIKPNLLNHTLRTGLMLVLILFLSGYSIVSVLYPKNNDLDILERLALSFAFPLIGFAFIIVLTNLLPIRYQILITNNTNTILTGLALITIVLLILGLFRRKKRIEENKIVYSRVNEVKNVIKPDLYGTLTDNNKYQASDDIKNDQISGKIAFKKEIQREENNKVYPTFVTKDLILIFLTTILTIAFVVIPTLNQTYLETIFVYLLILFIPGYVIIVALYPKNGDLNIIERVSLSFGLSIGIAALFGVLLKYSVLKYLTFGIKLTQLNNLNYTSLTIILSSFTLIMLLIAFIRRRRVPEGEKFYVNFGGIGSSIKEQFKGESRTSKILSIILIITILLAISTTVFIILKPKQGESFTEFYILGPNGKASDYPTNLTVGQNGTVIIGVVNHEYQTANYELVVRSNGTVMNQQNITLTNGNQTQIPYSFTAGSSGYKNIEFLLYKLPDTSNVYRSLHLYVNMT